MFEASHHSGTAPSGPRDYHSTTPGARSSRAAPPVPTAAISAPAAPCRCCSGDRCVRLVEAPPVEESGDCRPIEDHPVDNRGHQERDGDHRHVARRPSRRRPGVGAHAPRRVAVPRPRGHVVLGRPPHHRRADLLLPVRARARHRAGAGLARVLRQGHRHLQEPVRQPHGDRAGRRGAVPRAQRPPDHRRRLLDQGPALPAADAVGHRRGLGRRDGPGGVLHARAHLSSTCSGAHR